MPYGDTHRKQRAKNWLLFGVLAGLAGIFFAVAFIRVGAFS